MERRKVKNWDNVLPDQFQTVAAVLASDWCQKTCEDGAACDLTPERLTC